MALEIRQLTRLQIIRYCEKLENENKRLKVEKRELEYLWDINEELKEENQTLKDKIEFLHQCLDDRDKSIELLKEEKEIRALNDRDNLIQIEKLGKENKKMKEKIAKLEFDIEAWKKLKAVREEKIRMLNEKIGKLVMKS